MKIGMARHLVANQIGMIYSQLPIIIDDEPTHFLRNTWYQDISIEKVVFHPRIDPTTRFLWILYMNLFLENYFSFISLKHRAYGSSMVKVYTSDKKFKFPVKSSNIIKKIINNVKASRKTLNRLTYLYLSSKNCDFIKTFGNKNFDREI